ncbi:hypothetical protein GQX74_009524 [Glossina fuscipes]|nr:hypothetical protein GQX74_009524 [Glossina fuscipes]
MHGVLVSTAFLRNSPNSGVVAPITVTNVFEPFLEYTVLLADCSVFVLFSFDLMTTSVCYESSLERLKPNARRLNVAKYFEILKRHNFSIVQHCYWQSWSHNSKTLFEVVPAI